jgi:serine/threonine protein kinase
MIGRVIAGRYRIVSQLGSGGMGSVWRAEHLALGSPVALKLIDESIASVPEALERFEREAQASANLRSPHVVQVLDYGVDEGTPFLAMELLDGESLDDRLGRVGRLGPEETMRVVLHVARAIGKAHEAGVVHRDLKPGNIFLVRNDDEEVAKVLDFGIAKVEDKVSTSTRTGSMVGTPAYMSPEQAQGLKALDGRADLWSLGAIAYECLTGDVPFDAEAVGGLIVKICTAPLPVPSQVAHVPPGFDAWFAKALERNPDKRFQSAKELSDALRVALGLPGAGTMSSARFTIADLGTKTSASEAPGRVAAARTFSSHELGPSSKPALAGRVRWALAVASGLVLVVAFGLGLVLLRPRDGAPARPSSESKPSDASPVEPSPTSASPSNALPSDASPSDAARPGASPAASTPAVEPAPSASASAGQPEHATSATPALPSESAATSDVAHEPARTTKSAGSAARPASAPRAPVKGTSDPRLGF